MKRDIQLLGGPRLRGLRIGILGGSFNPAHDGHLYISLFALKRMRLDQVWWMVSPQNPLKDGDGMAPFDRRMTAARNLAQDHPRILVTDIENRLGTRFTADTLEKLKIRFPDARFVWMMGADNLLQIPRWQRWPDIFRLAPVAVFRRPPYFVGACRGKAAIRFSRERRNPALAPSLAETGGWILFNNRLHGESATRIRQNRKRT